VKALTLTQPWATLIACGEKRVETRSWRTPYRGMIAIHAAKGFPREVGEFVLGNASIKAALVRHGYTTLGDLPFAMVVATARLVACVPTDAFDPGRYAPDERAFGDYTPGLYAWVFQDVVPLWKPVPARGALGLWEWREGV